MLKHKIIRPLFYTALVLLLLGKGLLGIDLLVWIPVVLVIYLSIISWGAYFIDSGYFLDANCNGIIHKKEIAITFDDGPVRAVTPEVLGLLSDYGAKATFFCIGNKISGNEDLLKRMLSEGHGIGNHSWSHSFWFDLFGDKRVEEELIRFNKTLEEINGFKVIYFRPPYGVTNPVIARVVKKLGMPVIGWSVRSLDTTIKDPDQLFNRVRRKLKDGDIVLFHDSHSRVLPVLKKFLEYCKEKGYKPVTLEQLLKT